MMKVSYGKLRPEDRPALESAVRAFRANGLRSGLHGTSLWNPRYKDIDLLVVAFEKEGVRDFLKAVSRLKKQGAKVLAKRGNEKIGLDYDMKFGKAVLHVSYVPLL